MLFRDYIAGAQQPPMPEQLYTVGNEVLYAQAGVDIIRRRLIPNGEHRLFVGFGDTGIDNRIPTREALLPIFDTIGKGAGRYRIVMGKHDFTFDDAVFERLPENVLSLATCNLDSRDPRARVFPMGRDFRAREAAVARAPLPADARDTLCYANFSVNTHPSRPQLAKALEAKPFVTTEHMGAFLDYPISRETFIDRLARSKFAIAPRGNGIESFRMWDCLNLGVVPVVRREAALFDALEDLPILFVAEWSDFLDRTEADLEALFAEMLDRTYDYRKITLSYWLATAG